MIFFAIFVYSNNFFLLKKDYNIQLYVFTKLNQAIFMKHQYYLLYSITENYNKKL